MFKQLKKLGSKSSKSVPESAQAEASGPESISEAPVVKRWYRPSPLKVLACTIALVLLLPLHARGQFGIDTAAILAAFSKMQSLMSTYMAAPLKTINQYEQSTAKYEQEVMYPLAAINQAKSSVSQFEGQFSQLKNLFHINVSSATLPQSQGLESLLLSRNAGNLPSIASQYQSVYGVVGPKCGFTGRAHHDGHDRRAGPGCDEESGADRCICRCRAQ